MKWQLFILCNEDAPLINIFPSFFLCFFLSLFCSVFLSFFLSLRIRLFISQFFIKHSKSKILTYIMTLERSRRKINATVYPPTSKLTTLLIWIILPVLKIQKSISPIFVKFGKGNLL